MLPCSLAPHIWQLLNFAWWYCIFVDYFQWPHPNFGQDHSRIKNWKTEAMFTFVLIFQNVVDCLLFRGCWFRQMSLCMSWWNQAWLAVLHSSVAFIFCSNHSFFGNNNLDIFLDSIFRQIFYSFAKHVIITLAKSQGHNSVIM